MNVLDFSTSNAQVVDEIINVSDANPVTLKHNTFYNKSGKAMVIATGSGGGGTILTNPLDGASDYTPGDAYTFPEPYNTTLSGDVGYTTVAITNATYHNIDLYVSYYPIWDLLTAERWNNQNIIPHYLSSPYDISGTDYTINLEALNSYPIGTSRRIHAYDGDGSNSLDFIDNGETINGLDIADVKIEGTGGFILTKTGDGEFSAVGWLGGDIFDQDGGNFGNDKFEKYLTGVMIFKSWSYVQGNGTSNIGSIAKALTVQPAIIQHVESAFPGDVGTATTPADLTDFTNEDGNEAEIIVRAVDTAGTLSLSIKLNKKTSTTFSSSTNFGYCYGYAGRWTASFPTAS